MAIGNERKRLLLTLVTYICLQRARSAMLVIALVLVAFPTQVRAQTYGPTYFSGPPINGVSLKFYSYQAAGAAWGAQACGTMQCQAWPQFPVCMTSSQVSEGIMHWSSVCANCENGTCASGGGTGGSSGSACAAGAFDSGVGACGVAVSDENPAKRPRTPDCTAGSPVVGNPCNPASGVKVQFETDYVGSGPFPLRFERTYESSAVSGLGRSLGPQWGHNYESLILHDQSSRPNLATVIQADGRTLVFRLVGSAWVGDADLKVSLTKNGSIWQFTDENDVVQQFEQQPGPRIARLTSITARSGLSHTLQYYAASGTGYRAGLLQSVTDSMGRQLLIDYDTMGQRLSTVTDPDSKTIRYTYNPDGYLETIQYQDNTIRRYVYNELAHTSNVSGPWLLTGIIDENGNRYATYEYHDDSERRGKATWHGDNDVQKYVFSSYTSASTDVTAHVSASQTATRTYNFSTSLGVKRLTGITGPACPECGAAASTYGANGYLGSATDWNGNVTNYLRQDAARSDLETSRTEAVGTSVQRTVTTTWHPTIRLPAQIADPGRTTSFNYDANGNLLTKTVTSASSSRTWAYTYNANGSVLTVNGPRTDVSDVTTYTYYGNAATCPGTSPIGCRGQVETITNAVGHVTQIAEYNAHGQPLTIVDPNGLTTTLTYDLRQRLTSRSVGGEITSYDYDNVGQLTRMTLPDNSFLSYTYDNAHRLTEISDNLGNRIVYTLDGMGNRTQEQVRDPLNALAQTRSRVYSNLNRLSQEIGAASQTTDYGYDNQGNLTSIDGPLAGAVDVTTNAYDALNRLVRVTDPNAGQVNYGYNALDQLTSVSDPRTLVTSYSYDGLNNLNQQVLPDTGTTTNTYDAAGNLLTQTDAKGQVTTYTYDALNRVTTITFHDGSKQTYTYDQGANGIGRLTSVNDTDPQNQLVALINYGYDQKGRVISDERAFDSWATLHKVTYEYDTSGRLTRMTYPFGDGITSSGRVDYGYDGAGRINQISTTFHDWTVGTMVTRTVVQNVQYHPFGGVKGFTLGNGQNYTRGIDQDGRIASYTLGTQTFGLGFDPAGRVNLIAENGSPTNFNTYGYDALDRLTQAILPATTYGYSYDAVGNRLSRTAGSSTHTYAYGAASNRLSSITPNSGAVRNYLHDANGSVTADGNLQNIYDTRGRLIQSTNAAACLVAKFRVNALGQRVRKTITRCDTGALVADTIYTYDSNGRLLSENQLAGLYKRAYFYLHDMPVALYFNLYD